jgi:hypothetical protein
MYLAGFRLSSHRHSCTRYETRQKQRELVKPITRGELLIDYIPRSPAEFPSAGSGAHTR